MSRIGPPLEPGEIAAEIWRRVYPSSCRRPLTTPVLTEFSKPRGRVLQHLQRGLLRAWGAACGLLYYGDADASVSIPTTLKTYPDATELACLLRESGFRDVRSTTFMFGVIRTIVCRRGERF